MEKITKGIPEEFAKSLVALNKLTASHLVERELTWDESDDDIPSKEYFSDLEKEVQKEMEDTSASDFGSA